MLDFGVVANEWAAGSRAEVVQEVPWAPHLASRLYLRGRPRTIEADYQLRSRAIPSPVRPLAWTGPAGRDPAHEARDDGGADAQSVAQEFQHTMTGGVQALEHAALDAADFASDQRGRLPFMGRGSPKMAEEARHSSHAVVADAATRRRLDNSMVALPLIQVRRDQCVPLRRGQSVAAQRGLVQAVSAGHASPGGAGVGGTRGVARHPARTGGHGRPPSPRPLRSRQHAWRSSRRGTYRGPGGLAG